MFKSHLLGFTFQYGSTLIKTELLGTNDVNIFTFQYGSTLIKNKVYNMPLLLKIYIPIWFYFNIIVFIEA